MTDIDKFKISNDYMVCYGVVAISFNEDGSFNGFIACN